MKNYYCLLMSLIILMLTSVLTGCDSSSDEDGLKDVTYTVKGKVLIMDTNKPVAGIRVEITNPYMFQEPDAFIESYGNEKVVVYTDENGEFLSSVTHPWYQSSVTIATGEDTELFVSYDSVFYFERKDENESILEKEIIIYLEEKDNE